MDVDEVDAGTLGRARQVNGTGCTLNDRLRCGCGCPPSPHHPPPSPTYSTNPHQWRRARANGAQRGAQKPPLLPHCRAFVANGQTTAALMAISKTRVARPSHPPTRPRQCMRRLSIRPVWPPDSGAQIAGRTRDKPQKKKRKAEVEFEVGADILKQICKINKMLQLVFTLL